MHFLRSSHADRIRRRLGYGRRAALEPAGRSALRLSKHLKFGNLRRRAAYNLSSDSARNTGSDSELHHQDVGPKLALDPSLKHKLSPPEESVMHSGGGSGMTVNEATFSLQSTRFDSEDSACFAAPL